MPQARAFASWPVPSLPGRQAAAFFGSRLVNGLLALVQVTLAVRALGPSQSGRFFMVFTAAWLLATVLKFGIDGILPRTVAESDAASSTTPSSLPQLVLGVWWGALALPVAVLVLRVPLTASMVGSVLGLAVTWAALLICAGLLKAKGRVATSGLVANVIWPLSLVLAAVIVLVLGGTAATLALTTLGFAAAALLVSVAITGWTLGGRELVELVGDGTMTWPERDAYGAALLSVLYEVIVWLPVVLAALLGASPTATGGIFAATRVAGVFSWGYQAVVAMLTPRLARALALGQAAHTRLLLQRGALLGAIVTVPLCAAGAVWAHDILHLVEPRYAAFSTILALLVLARAVDAVAGPVGEALLVGRRTWLDCSIVAVGVGVGAAVSFALHPTVGDVAAGAGAATAFVFINVARVAVVARLLAHGWSAVRFPLLRGRSVGVLGSWVAGLLGAGAAAALWEAGGGVRSVYFCAAGGSVGGIALVALAARVHGWRAVLQSPLLIVGLLLLTEFGLRPISLALDPGSASDALREVGFAWTDVTRAGALGLGGLVLFGAAFVAAWGPSLPRPHQGTPDSPPAHRLIVGLLATLLVGCLLWIALFVRLGGPSALVDNPAALHLGQFGGGYGVFGMMLCFGVGLTALWLWCRQPTRTNFRLALAGLGAGTVASVCLATRGPLIATALAGFALVLRSRNLRPRAALALGAVAILLASGLMVLRTVRGYQQVAPLTNALAATMHTPPLTILTAELVEFDHLVVLEQAVPSALPWLSGKSFADVPGTFLPRALWPAKPLPIDFRLSREVLGRETKAGTPFTLPGEAYWNFGLWGALATMVVLGATAGLVWRLLQRRGWQMSAIAAALVYGYSYLVLTRPLAPMLMTTTLAILAAITVCLAGGVWRPVLATPPWLTRVLAGQDAQRSVGAGPAKHR